MGVPGVIPPGNGELWVGTERKDFGMSSRETGEAGKSGNVNSTSSAGFRGQKKGKIIGILIWEGMERWSSQFQKELCLLKGIVCPEGNCVSRREFCLLEFLHLPKPTMSGVSAIRG